VAALVAGQKIVPPRVRVNHNPLLPLAVLFTGFGLQCIMMGLLAELLMRTYHESQGKATYVVSHILEQGQREDMEETEAITQRLAALR
jgi:hypothetical protein